MEGLDYPGEALSAEDIAAWASALPADQDAVLFLTGEECRVPEDMMEILRTAAERTGRTLRFTGMEEYRKTVHKKASSIPAPRAIPWLPGAIPQESV